MTEPYRTVTVGTMGYSPLWYGDSIAAVDILTRGEHWEIWPVNVAAVEASHPADIRLPAGKPIPFAALEPGEDVGTHGLEALYESRRYPHALHMLIWIGMGGPRLVRLEVETRSWAERSVRATDHAAAITGRTLRQLALTELVARCVDLWLQHNGSKGLPGRLRVLAAQAEREAAFRDLTSNEQLARVALLYREAARLGRRPNEDVAAALGYSRSHVARMVGRARDAGLLGPARRGKGGELQ